MSLCRVRAGAWLVWSFAAWGAAGPAMTQAAPLTAGQPAVNAGPLATRVAGLLAGPEVRGAHWGISVVDVETGAPLFALNDRQMFEPASNAKLFTTAAALGLLGPGTRLTTTVQAQGVVPPDGHLLGGLRLVGYGDPSLSGRSYPWAGKTVRDGAPLGVLDELAQQVAARGVKVVEGGVVGDDTLFAWERYGSGWGWDDLQWEYGAPVSALAVNDNVRYLTVAPGARPGDTVVASWDPLFTAAGAGSGATNAGAAAGQLTGERVTPAIDTAAEPVVESPDGLKVTARTGAPGGEAHVGVSREVDGGPLRIYGTLPAGGRAMHLAVAVHDPALFAAQGLVAALRRAGVEVHGEARVEHWEAEDTASFAVESRAPLALAMGSTDTPNDVLSGERQVVASHASPTLGEIVMVVNKVSQNLHAEMLLRLLGKTVGEGGSVVQGVRVVRAFAMRAGVDGEELSFVDGSGLSPKDLVTPRAVTTLLVYAGRQSWGAVLRGSLPVGGVDGTLAGRFTEAGVKGRVVAKTGTLGEVNALSGYLTAGSGRVVAFSVLVNDGTHPEAVRKAMDGVVGAVEAAF